MSRQNILTDTSPEKVYENIANIITHLLAGWSWPAELPLSFAKCKLPPAPLGKWFAMYSANIGHGHNSQKNNLHTFLFLGEGWLASSQSPSLDLMWQTPANCWLWLLGNHWPLAIWGWSFTVSLSGRGCLPPCFSKPVWFVGLPKKTSHCLLLLPSSVLMSFHFKELVSCKLYSKGL